MVYEVRRNDIESYNAIICSDYIYYNRINIDVIYKKATETVLY